MWLAWAKIYYYYPMSKNDIKEAPIWYNSDIRNANKPCKNSKETMEKICKVSQIYDCNNKKFYTHNEIKQKYGNIINFVDLYSIQQAMPKSWIKTFKSNVTAQDSNTKIREDINKIGKMSKTAYKMLLTKLIKTDKN